MRISVQQSIEIKITTTRTSSLYPTLQQQQRNEQQYCAREREACRVLQALQKTKNTTKKESQQEEASPLIDRINARLAECGWSSPSPETLTKGNTL